MPLIRFTPRKEMQLLFRKYLDNQCSESEVNKLLHYFNVPENESVLRELITESLEKANVEDDSGEWDAVSDEVFAEIKKRLNEKEGKRSSVVHQLWFRVAAAVILLAGTVTAFLFINNTSSQQELVHAVDPVNKTKPGNSKAVLTLGNGST